MSDAVHNDTVHKSVLLKEIIDALVPESPDGIHADPFIYLDGTLGGAGHAIAFKTAFAAKKKLPKLTIIGLDRDTDALKRAVQKLGSDDARFDTILENEDFRNLDKVLDKHAVDRVDRILLDLGISSDELDNSGRGFTFLKDEPLLMTMGDPAGYPFTAKTIVNDWDEEVIANIIFGYAEERFARRIARVIVSYRQKKMIETSGELAEIVKSSVPGFYRRGKIHPATKTFQALRIAVNDELNALREGLAKGFERLREDGIMAVISFHSLEDRIVKEFFKARDNAKILTKKPITPSAQEKAENPRSRSAKLRIIRKTSQE